MRTRSRIQPAIIRPRQWLWQEGYQPMHMLRHDHEGIQADMRVMTGQVQPDCLDSLTGWAQLDFDSECFGGIEPAKQRLSAFGADRDEIAAWLGIVIPWQA